MITEKQRIDRVNYLGGSDAPAVLGLSRYKTALAVWGEKTGNIVPDDISDHLPVKLGNKLEDTVAELFMEETGFKVRRVNETLFHPEYPFLGANIDRRVVGNDAILECKTCSPWKMKEWDGEEIPTEYVLQVMHYLAVTGKKQAYLAVLIGNQDFKVKLVERDDAVIADMVKRQVHFWRTYVEPKEMPMIITANDSDTLYQLFPMVDETAELELGDDVQQLCELRNAMIVDKKNLEAQIERTENEIKAQMKTAAVAKTVNSIITWKPQSRKSVDGKALQERMPEIYAKFVKETTFKTLRIRPIKE